MDRLDRTKLPPAQRDELRKSGATLLDPRELDLAIVDVAPNGAAVYDYEMLVALFAVSQGWSYGDATEWVSYNTMRALPYMPEPRPRIRFRNHAAEHHEETTD